MGGELLLTAGVLIGLFVVWQLWWTDVIATGEQQQISETLERGYDIPSTPQPAQPRTDAPPPPVDTVVQGEAFATLHVPRWGSDHEVPIAEGIGMDVLNTGSAGHYPDTAMPGELGNFALAGHRQTYGAAFRYVDRLQVGDPLIVETADAWLIYRVTEDYIVTPDQVDVVAPTPRQPRAEPTQRIITLTTCHPLWSTAQRWITHGVLEEWIPRSEGMPTQLLESNN